MTSEHKDAECICVYAQQLNALMQTIFEGHTSFDPFRLDALLGLAYDMAGKICILAEEEEKAAEKEDIVEATKK